MEELCLFINLRSEGQVFVSTRSTNMHENSWRNYKFLDLFFFTSQRTFLKKNIAKENLFVSGLNGGELTEGTISFPGPYLRSPPRRGGGDGDKSLGTRLNEEGLPPSLLHFFWNSPHPPTHPQRIVKLFIV